MKIAVASETGGNIFFFAFFDLGSFFLATTLAGFLVDNERFGFGDFHLFAPVVLGDKIWNDIGS